MLSISSNCPGHWSTLRESGIPFGLSIQINKALIYNKETLPKANLISRCLKCGSFICKDSRYRNLHKWTCVICGKTNTAIGDRYEKPGLLPIEIKQNRIMGEIEKISLKSIKPYSIIILIDLHLKKKVQSKIYKILKKTVKIHKEQLLLIGVFDENLGIWDPNSNLPHLRFNSKFTKGIFGTKFPKYKSIKAIYSKTNTCKIIKSIVNSIIKEDKFIFSSILCFIGSKTFDYENCKNVSKLSGKNSISINLFSISDVSTTSREISKISNLSKLTSGMIIDVDLNDFNSIIKFIKEFTKIPKIQRIKLILLISKGLIFESFESNCLIKHSNSEVEEEKFKKIILSPCSRKNFSIIGWIGFLNKNINLSNFINIQAICLFSYFSKGGKGKGGKGEEEEEGIGIYKRLVMFENIKIPTFSNPLKIIKSLSIPIISSMIVRRINSEEILKIWICNQRFWMERNRIKLNNELIKISFNIKKLISNLNNDDLEIKTLLFNTLSPEETYRALKPTLYVLRNNKFIISKIEGSKNKINIYDNFFRIVIYSNSNDFEDLIQLKINELINLFNSNNIVKRDINLLNEINENKNYEIFKNEVLEWVKEAIDNVNKLFFHFSTVFNSMTDLTT